jgi:hypothetical protein
MCESALLRDGDHDLIAKVHDHDIRLDTIHQAGCLFCSRGKWQIQVQRLLQYIVQSRHV